MTDTDENARMREASGKVDDPRRLVSFLYVLLRDEVTPGRMETILDRLGPGWTGSQFTNGWLALYAKDAAARLGCGVGPEAPLLDVAALHERIKFWRGEAERLEKLGFRDEAIRADGQIDGYQNVLIHHGLPEVP